MKLSRETQSKLAVPFRPLLLVMALALASHTLGLAASGSSPVPLINQPLVPDATAPGGQGFTLTVNGTGFVSGATVNWNGSPLATTFVSGSQLIAGVPAWDIATAGTASVTVTSPNAGAGSNVAFLQVISSSASLTFGRSDVPTAAGPQELTVADFNADGKLDLAITNEDSNGNGQVSVVLGNGDGTFGAATAYLSGGLPYGVTAADFNGDGKLDLAVTNLDNSTVGVLLGNGDGTFAAATNFGTQFSPTQVAAGDFNGDGKLDLAVVCVGGVALLLGNGDGTFQAQSTVLAGTDSFAATIGDFNRDGKLDLAVSVQGSHGDQVWVFLGNGDGTFQPPAAFNLGTLALSLVTADLNGDGKLDLVGSSSNGTAIDVLLGNGDGTFQPFVAYSTPSGPISVAAGDFNGDGKLDLATGNAGANSVSVLLGNGDGTFQDHLDFGTGNVPFAIASGDFSGDGRLDLVSGNFLDNTFSVLLQQAGVTFSPASLTFATQLIGTGSPPQTVTLSNGTGSVLTITGISIEGSTDFSQSNTCGSSVPAGGSCTISITFAPSVQGAITATVTANTSAGGASFAVSGTGTESRLSPARVNFGSVSVGTSKTSKVALTNTGSATLTVLQVGIFGANRPDFSQTNNCGSKLGPKASCTFTVTFKPTGQGARNATLSVNDTGTGIGGVPQGVQLHGNGT